MTPSLFYLPEICTHGGPSAREMEALREARRAEIRTLLAAIAAKPQRDHTPFAAGRRGAGRSVTAG